MNICDDIPEELLNELTILKFFQMPTLTNFKKFLFIFFLLLLRFSFFLLKINIKINVFCLL